MEVKTTSYEKQNLSFEHQPRIETPETDIYSLIHFFSDSQLREKTVKGADNLSKLIFNQYKSFPISPRCFVILFLYFPQMLFTSGSPCPVHYF